MLIPVISTLQTSNFPGEESWIGSLLSPINNFLLSATSALNGNITFTDNIPCQAINMQFTYNAATDFPKIIAWQLNSNASQQTPLNPTKLEFCNGTENGAAVALVPIWSFANATITIQNFVKLTTSGATGLVAGSSYIINLRGQP